MEQNNYQNQQNGYNPNGNQGSFNPNSNQNGAYQNYGPNGQPGYQGPGYGQPVIPEEYRPISMWGYFGYQILFAIPIVGLICLIVFAITAKNVNLKNFARSYFCVLIIAIIVFAIVAASGMTGALLGNLW